MIRWGTAVLVLATFGCERAQGHGDQGQHGQDRGAAGQQHHGLPERGEPRGGDAYPHGKRDHTNHHHERGAAHGAPETIPAGSLAVGDKVEGIVVTDLAGKSWNLSELQKRAESGVVSLTFWCTFCHSCRMMDARFQKLASDFKDKAAVVGIDASAADNAKKIEEFARNKQFSVPIFVDAGGKVADLFGIRLTTTTIVIDKAGVLRYRGQFDGNDGPHAENALQALLAGKELAVKETTPKG